MQKFTRIAALLLVAVAVVLAILAFSIGRRVTRPIADGAAFHARSLSAPTATVPVVVAAMALPAGTPLIASSLQTVSWAQRPAEGYGNVAAVVGSVPLVDIPAGAPMTSTLLARGVAMALRAGERAIAVPVDEQAGAGNRVLPGDYVDVFVSLKAPPAMSYQPNARDNAVDPSQARLLLSRLRVLAYGDNDLPSAPAEPSPSAASDDRNAKAVADGDSKQTSSTQQGTEATKSVPHTAVLAVPVGEASQLLLAVQNGKLSLGVRQPADDGQPDDALFPQPHPVLTARAHLTNDQQQQLLQPENQAYAGIDGSGLAGHDSAAKKPVRSDHARAYQGIEIIRGSANDGARANRTNP
jgi:pilus assembly protein CpaB